MRYSYTALTSGVTKIRDGDFAFSTKIEMNKIVQKEGFQEKHFVDAIIETKFSLIVILRKRKQ